MVLGILRERVELDLRGQLDLQGQLDPQDRQGLRGLTMVRLRL